MRFPMSGSPTIHSKRASDPASSNHNAGLAKPDRIHFPLNALPGAARQLFRRKRVKVCTDKTIFVRAFCRTKDGTHVR